MRRSISSFQTTAVSLLTSAAVTFAPQARAEWDARCAIDEVATIQGIECLVARFLSLATTFIGLAAFVMLIVGGFLYLTSGGNSKGAEAARQTMTYAIVGIIVALSAAFILRLISGFTGVTGILNFNLFLE